MVDIILKLKRKVVKIVDIIYLFVIPVFHPIGLIEEPKEFMNPQGIVLKEEIDLFVVIDILPITIGVP